MTTAITQIAIMNIYSTLYDMAAQPNLESFCLNGLKIYDVIEKNKIAIPETIMEEINDFLNSHVRTILKKVREEYLPIKEGDDDTVGEILSLFDNMLYDIMAFGEKTLSHYLIDLDLESVDGEEWFENMKN